MNEIINEIINIIRNIGPISGVVLILLESIFPILPLGLFIGFNIISFGVILGFIISYFSTTLGCLISFYLFKYVFKDKYEKIIKKKNLIKLKKLTNNIKNIKIRNLTLFIACPFSPAFLINIACGLSNVDNKKYIISLFVGKLSIIYFWGYIGVSLINSFKNPVILFKIFVIMILAYYISRIIEKKINID